MINAVFNEFLPYVAPIIFVVLAFFVADQLILTIKKAFGGERGEY